MSELRDLQRAFAAALQPDGQERQAPPGLEPAAALDVYRNNARQGFARALALTYPVIERRVGADFFVQLTREYEAAHPSRHGDLHWVGADFPAWLAARFAGTGYEWLADLARLEWACEAAVVATELPPVSVGALRDVPAEALAGLRFEFQPSVALVDSPWPLWSVWQANQPDADGAPVDLAAGAEACVVACADERVAVHRLDRTDFQLLQGLSDGRPLGEAMESAQADGETLQRLLAWAFRERLVVGVSSSGDR